MPNVSLTIFIDFLLCNGSRRLRRLQEWIDGPSYERKFDFWAQMRNWAIDGESGEITRADFMRRARSVTPTKTHRYDQNAQGFLKFSKKNGGIWRRPPTGKWKYGDLTINVNPELAYDVGAERVAVKLYFKSEQLSADKAAIIGYLMNATLPGMRLACST